MLIVKCKLIMSRLKLITDPNSILRTKNSDLAFPLSKESRELIDRMIFACKKFKGVGLAAPQIGHNLNLAIINLGEYELPPFPIINPKITSCSFKKHSMEEGCLSLPNLYGMLKRPEKITVKFYNSEGKKIKLKLNGFIANVFQHEIDHLNGILIADKWDKKTVHSYDRNEKKN